MSRLAAREQLALRKLGNPQGFQFFAWEFLEPDTTILIGCVVTRTHTRGPKRGRPIYDGERRKVAVTEAEIEQEKRRHEAETGACGECFGDGKEFAGWHHRTGTSWRTCRRCSGTGRIGDHAEEGV